jgi:RimJ/RimL family protein N-acetyltransferase
MISRPFAPKKIEYGQYVLRPVTPEDVPKIEEARNLSLEDLRVYMDWVHTPYERNRFLERVLLQLSNYYRGEEYEMGFFDISHENFLVYTGFYPSVRINPHSYEIGFWTATPFKGKGFATLATKLQIALIFEYFKGDRIEITCNVENAASRRVIEKCGFLFEGELRNFYPQGTEEMFAAGYTKERRVAFFALTPRDRSSLPWYEELLKKTRIYTLLEEPASLKDFS